MTIQNLKSGDPFIYMKVGIHAQEDLADIIKRKRAEIAKAGVAFWGYGGNTCHPLHAVQPFVKDVVAKGHTVHLLMQEINSKHRAEPARAKSYSIDGQNWIDVPKGINVLGSRFALVLSSLEEVNFGVALSDTKVGIGRLAGKAGADYIRGHVDKACLVFSPGAGDGKPELVTLRLAAEVKTPYAVLLK